MVLLLFRRRFTAGILLATPPAPATAGRFNEANDACIPVFAQSIAKRPGAQTVEMRRG